MATGDILSTANIHPEFAPIWESVKDQMPAFHGDLQALRTILVERKKSMSDATPGGGPSDAIIEENITIKARDGFQIPCVLYKPSSPPSGGSPIAVLFHGGGFIAGETINEAMTCRLFTSKLGFTCVNVDYRLGPEHLFPHAQNDAWDATKWVAANAAALGADPTKGFIAAGTSAGGNLTDVVGHLARDENLSPPLTGLIEMIPVVIPCGHPPDAVKSQYLSWEQNKDSPILPQITMNWMLDLFKPDFNSSLAFPFIHPHGHKNMPPIFFQVCGMDPLRDDSIIYERVLREECGVQTRLKMYPGVPHGWWSAFPTMALSQQFVQDTVEGAAWLLSLAGK